MAGVPPDFADVIPGDAKVDVPSTWRDVIIGNNTVSTETAPLKSQEVTTQTGSRDNNGTQTDDGGRPASPTKLKASGIADFVKKVEDMVAGELVKATEEAEVLEPFTRAADDEQEPATCVQYLSPFQPDDSAVVDLNATSTQINKHKLVVTCLSWSSTGQTIAASYGRYDIVGWCTFPGALCTWNLAREEINSTRPDQRIDTDTCLMSCAFHPTHPALIAGGTFNGELYVWDLSLEGDLQRGRSDVLLDVRHMEPILNITWQYNLTDAAKYGTKDKAYRLVTLGADGRVLTWLWHKLEAPIYGYQLLFPQPGIDRRFVWGGACMCFQREPRGASTASGGRGIGGEAAGTFLVGTEGGKIFKCYNDANDTNTKVSGQWPSAPDSAALSLVFACELSGDEHFMKHDNNIVDPAGPWLGEVSDSSCLPPGQRGVFPCRTVRQLRRSSVGRWLRVSVWSCAPLCGMQATRLMRVRYSEWTARRSSASSSLPPPPMAAYGYTHLSACSRCYTWSPHPPTCSQCNGAPSGRWSLRQQPLTAVCTCTTWCAIMRLCGPC
ncbi:hypothetical protein Vretifemale_10742 [Volvox reticuliferus]|uniref:Uncharacterized protein n=1 Tax=Volvox reticuliferus TaxID=1737510 RepID=A0A8J4FLV6_9CHLO|nr:hypothetical protein Vretifemale_10742 [Volvox reticuliferus]